MRTLEEPVSIFQEIFSKLNTQPLNVSDKPEPYPVGDLPLDLLKVVEEVAGIVLARIAPPLKAAAEKVQFEFRTDVPLSQQAEAVMAAIAAGEVDPETGKSLIAALQNVAGIKAIEDLEQRIIQLEAKQIG
jgi:hypothetical protein